MGYFTVKHTGQRLSINDIVRNIKFQDNTTLFDKLTPNQESIEASVPLSFRDSSNILLVELNTKIYRIGMHPVRTGLRNKI